MADKSQKTEKPTGKRRKQAKQDGNIARTPDLSAWLTVLVVLVLVSAAVGHLRDVFNQLIGAIQETVLVPDVATFKNILGLATSGAWGVLAPILFGCMLLGSAGHIVQGGMKPYMKRVRPQWKKLNPTNGIKSMMGKHAVWQLIKTLLKFVAFGWVTFIVVRGVTERMTSSGTWPLMASVQIAEEAAMSMMRLIALLGLFLAAADYAMEKKRNSESLKMTKEEVKQEMRQSEGDPMLKQAIKSRQRDMSRRRMMAAVADASVVVTNPTHIAVALRYEPGQGAPEVVAKGSGYIAQRIRQEAEANQVPMVRDPIVARAIFKACEVGQAIPIELYDAIAQILAFIMRLSGMGRGGGTHDTPIRHPTPIGGGLPPELSDRALGISASSSDR